MCSVMSDQNLICRFNNYDCGFCHASIVPLKTDVEYHRKQSKVVTYCHPDIRDSSYTDHHWSQCTSHSNRQCKLH